MKKTLLVLAVLFTAISSSFAGQVYLSASGFYPSGPIETGTYEYVQLNDYYAHYVTVSGGVSNVYDSNSFCATDFGSSAGSYNYRYGNLPNPSSSQSFSSFLGVVESIYGYVYCNLEVFGLDGWARIDY